MSKITKRTNNAELKITKHAANSFNACIERVIDGKASLQDLLNVKKAEIDFAKCTRKIKMIQRIYSAGSQVGACTIVAGNMFTVKLTKETMEQYKKALKMLEAHDNHVPYGESLWVEGYNMFSEFNFATGKRYVYYVVTNAEIEELARRIKAMDYNSVTLEDLQALQNDLPPFVRAWQESSIDVSKDKDKVFNMTFADFFKKIEVTSTFLKKQMEMIDLNLDNMKLLHKAGRTKDMSFEITLPTNDKVVADILGDINYAIKDATEEYFNDNLLELYKMANRNRYEQYMDECLECPELALFIQQVFTLVTQSFNEDTKLTKEDYASLRNKIYTKAAAYGITGDKVVRVAVSVAMRSVKLTGKDIDLGTANVDNYKPFKVMSIFPNEYVALIGGEKLTKELTLLYVEKGREIVEGEEVEFAAGFSIDDTVEVEELFTGIAYNKGGKLVYDIDVYSYEESKALITTATFVEGTTPQEQETDLGEFAASFLDTNDKIILTGKNHNVLASKTEEGQTILVGKAVPSKELMPNNKPVIFTITNMMSYEPKAGRARVFLLEIQ